MSAVANPAISAAMDLAVAGATAAAAVAVARDQTGPEME